MDKLEQVTGQTFSNCEVEIDGKEFVDCVFQDCTIRFAGKHRFDFVNSRFGKGIRWEISSHAQYTAWYLAYLGRIPRLDQLVGLIFDDIRAGKIDYPEDPSLGFAPPDQGKEIPTIKLPSLEMLEPPKTLTPVSNRVFEGQEVRLDGYQFVGCTFRNCTFMYGATAEMQMIGCKTEGSLGVLFDQNARFMLNFFQNLAGSSLTMFDEIIGGLRKAGTELKANKPKPS